MESSDTQQTAKFGEYEAENADVHEQPEVDRSKYTVVDPDNLDEDPKIAGQQYVVLSFLSPEGIMNCNQRAVKCRGVYDTPEKAQERCSELEKIDPYFKMFIGDVGKWLDFDPPPERVDREMCSNKQYQALLDAQREQRMKKINELAGKYKEIADKKEKGKAERITENKKSSVAENVTCSSSSSSSVAPAEPAPPVQPKESARPKTKQRNNLDAIRQNMRRTYNARKAEQQPQDANDNGEQQSADGFTPNQTDNNISAIKNLIAQRKK